jgi:3,4-dihydroxy 2-butanone 4-phosphate synthase/GTP cyclohydrolase II
MNDDGTMARRPDLVRFAQLHGLKIATISDLIAYRLRHDHIVEKTHETVFESAFGGTWRMCVFVNRIARAEHIALVKGDVATPAPVLVRMHALNVLDDVLGASAKRRGGLLQSAMREIDREGRGVVVLLREPTPTSIVDRLAGNVGSGVRELRDYGIGAQILRNLGVHEMVLLTNTRRTIIALEGYGLAVAGQRPIPPEGAA